MQAEPSGRSLGLRAFGVRKGPPDLFVARKARDHASPTHIEGGERCHVDDIGILGPQRHNLHRPIKTHQ